MGLLLVFMAPDGSSPACGGIHPLEPPTLGEEGGYRQQFAFFFKPGRSLRNSQNKQNPDSDFRVLRWLPPLAQRFFWHKVVKCFSELHVERVCGLVFVSREKRFLCFSEVELFSRIRRIMAWHSYPCLTDHGEIVFLLTNVACCG